MRPSVLVFNFKPEFSTTHLYALSHFKSQSGPAWHLICSGFDTPKSLATPVQLQAPKSTTAMSTSRTYGTKLSIAAAKTLSSLLSCLAYYKEDPAAISGQVAHQGRGAADCGEYGQTAGVAASKVIRGQVPMSAFGGKADIP